MKCLGKCSWHNILNIRIKIQCKQRIQYIQFIGEYLFNDYIHMALYIVKYALFDLEYEYCNYQIHNTYNPASYVFKLLIKDKKILLKSFNDTK